MIVKRAAGYLRGLTLLRYYLRRLRLAGNSRWVAKLLRGRY